MFVLYSQPRLCNSAQSSVKTSTFDFIFAKSNKFSIFPDLTNLELVSVSPIPQVLLTAYPEKTANISRRHHWFLCEVMSEKRAQKFHTDDASLPRTG